MGPAYHRVPRPAHRVHLGVRRPAAALHHRTTVGHTVRARLVNDLPAPTTVHWHGIRIAPEMDGSPGFSAAANPARQDVRLRVHRPLPEHDFYHLHAGMQSDRGLYGALIVEDPHEPSAMMTSSTVVLDDSVTASAMHPHDALRRVTPPCTTRA